jgi:hypothetical protein
MPRLEHKVFWETGIRCEGFHRICFFGPSLNRIYDPRSVHALVWRWCVRRRWVGLLTCVLVCVLVCVLMCVLVCVLMCGLVCGLV